MSRIESYVRNWMDYQALWDIDPEFVYNSLGEDLGKWQKMILEVKKARSTFDTSTTEIQFGEFCLHFDQVQAKVSAKYDSWQKEMLSKFASKLDLTSRTLYNDLNRSRTNLEQQPPLEGSTTAEAVVLITLVQELKRKFSVWSEEIEHARGGQKLLERQRFQFPADWLHIESLDGAWSSFSDIFKKKNNFVQEQTGIQSHRWGI